MEIVIFGITGHLAQKKLLPALKELILYGEFPTDTRIIGFARSKKEIDPMVEFVEGDYSNKEDLEKLGNILRKDGPVFLYFALPQAVYKPLIENIYQAKIKGTLMLEKPFGHDLESAVDLCDFIKGRFKESQVLLVDHYAGKKELRPEFIRENILEKKSALSEIKKIEIKLLEEGTVESRGGFYDQLGALYDVGQNHLLFTAQTFLNAMNGTNYRGEIMKDLKVEKGSSMRGQYEGYLNEDGVKKDSSTETFFRIQAKYKEIDLIMMSGKALGKSESSVSLYSEKEIDKIILTSGTDAYKNIFRDAVSENSKSFISYDEAIINWKFVEEAKRDMNTSNPVIYKKGSLPDNIVFDIK